jgi:hypothetical protein
VQRIAYQTLVARDVALLHLLHTLVHPTLCYAPKSTYQLQGLQLTIDPSTITCQMPIYCSLKDIWICRLLWKPTAGTSCMPTCDCHTKHNTSHKHVTSIQGSQKHSRAAAVAGAADAQLLCCIAQRFGRAVTRIPTPFSIAPLPVGLASQPSARLPDLPQRKQWDPAGSTAQHHSQRAYRGTQLCLPQGWRACQQP